MDQPATFDGRPGVTDTLGRAMRDLRISVTDRCNFRCTYCMPKEVFGRDYEFLPRDEVLTFEEITRVARAAVGLGVEKLRITGGEPLVRRDLPSLIAMLAEIRRPDGEGLDLTLTTNGSALRAHARALVDAGLRRVTVSLDSLDDAVFGAMNGIDFPVAKVLDGIDAAMDAGLAPVKVNMVVRRGVNETSIVPMAELGARDRRDPPLHRVHGRRALERLAARRGRPGRGPDRRRSASAGRSSPRTRPTAARSRTAGATWTVPASSASSRRSPSRSAATARARGSRPTASSTRACSRWTGRDVRAVLRGGADDEAMVAFLADTWSRRDDRYSELRSRATTSSLPKVEMFAMGG